ncbi:hypothetical protein GGX14DRAFT_408978 [Mycena pura]|uniref:Uncharacterized protein n=1 Tax=Mycena pura TaxID=153505 RepID=A0AAD6XXA0_9AGAR|nr:hypothetical protein GGX14DRAFT_408978 [Mycena pura]
MAQKAIFACAAQCTAAVSRNAEFDVIKINSGFPAHPEDIWKTAHWEGGVEKKGNYGIQIASDFDLILWAWLPQPIFEIPSSNVWVTGHSQFELTETVQYCLADLEAESTQLSSDSGREPNNESAGPLPGAEES